MDTDEFVECFYIGLEVIAKVVLVIAFILTLPLFLPFYLLILFIAFVGYIAKKLGYKR